MSVIHWTGNVWFGSIYNTEIDWWPLVKSRAAHFSRVNGAEHNGERERIPRKPLSLSLSFLNAECPATFLTYDHTFNDLCPLSLQIQGLRTALTQTREIE